ncbi:hypothetical protein Tco_0470002 [Tanacetum coccineum]
MQEKPTTIDEYALFGSTGVAIMQGKSTTDSRNKAFDSEATFTPDVATKLASVTLKGVRSQVRSLLGANNSEVATPTS